MIKHLSVEREKTCWTKQKNRDIFIRFLSIMRKCHLRRFLCYRHGHSACKVEHAKLNMQRDQAIDCWIVKGRDRMRWARPKNWEILTYLMQQRHLWRHSFHRYGHSACKVMHAVWMIKHLIVELAAEEIEHVWTKPKNREILTYLMQRRLSGFPCKEHVMWNADNRVSSM